MDWIDPGTEERIWQRVHGTPDAGEEELVQLIREEWQDASDCARLAKSQPAPWSSALGQMAREAKTHAGCLTGIYRLTTGHRPQLPPPPQPKQRPEVALRYCFTRKLRRATQYERRTADPEYGFLFRQLCRREREHCCTLLEIMGNFPEKGEL